MRLATHASQSGLANVSLALAFDNGSQAVGLDRFREDLRIADSLCFDDKGMGAGVARQKDDPSLEPVVAKPRVGVDARSSARTQVDVENRDAAPERILPQSRQLLVAAHPHASTLENNGDQFHDEL